MLHTRIKPSYDCPTTLDSANTVLGCGKQQAIFPSSYHASDPPDDACRILRPDASLRLLVNRCPDETVRLCDLVF